MPWQGDADVDGASHAGPPAALGVVDFMIAIGEQWRVPSKR